jgi:hypothetical protein
MQGLQSTVDLSLDFWFSDGISDTTTDSEENSTAKQARVEFITEMTGTAQPVESSQPYYQYIILPM